MPNHRMEFRNLAVRIIFLSQTTVGILGNFSLLSYYLALYYRGCTLKPTDLILKHLMAANTLIILSAGVPHTVAAFGVKQFLNDFGCRLILYIQRVGRSVSISTTCFLSVFQAMTISPRKSRWKHHQGKTAKYISCSVFLLWVLYTVINFIFFGYVFAKSNSMNVTIKRNFEYCSTVVHNEISESLYTALIVCPEVFFSVLIAWSSGSMIVILYRHKQSVKHTLGTCSSSRTSPESRATQNILALLSTFLMFYTLSSILQGCIALLYNHHWWLVNITGISSLCFPSSVPFILMNHSSIASRLNFVWKRNRKCLIYFKYIANIFRMRSCCLLSHHP